MDIVITFVRRGVLMLAVVAVAFIGSGGVSAAQDRPDVPAPSAPPNFNFEQSDTDEGNDFQQDYADCREGEGNGLIGAGVDAVLRMVNPAIGAILTTSDNPVRCTAQAGAAHPVDAAATAIENVSSAFWGDPVGKFAKAVMEGNISAFATVMTFWLSAPIPGLSGATAMDGIRNITFELQFVFLAFGLLFSATRLAIARKQAVLDGAEETAKMITRTIFAVTLLPLLVITLHAIGDSFSTFVIQMATGNDPGAAIKGLAWIDEETGLGPVVSLLFAGLALLGSVVQLIALIIREAILTLAIGLAPMAAAISVTNSGRMSWNSIMTFTAGALLFKPVASLIYAFAFWAGSSDVVASAIVGAVLLAVAGLALPQIIRIVAPAAESISGSGAQMAGMAGAAGAIAGSLASGSGGRGVSGSGAGAGGGAGKSGSAASGAAGYGGQYTGSGGGASSGGRAASPNGASASRSSGSAAGGMKAGAAKAAGLAGGAAVGVAKALQMAGSGVSTASNIAEGAVGNYHGRVSR